MAVSLSAWCRSFKLTCIRTLAKFVRRSARSHEEDLLQLWYIHRKASPEDIAKMLNCSVEDVKRKLINYDMMRPDGTPTPGTFLGVFTGRFHYAKADLIAAIKSIRRTEKVVKRTDELYTQTKSVNARILKEILAEMDEADDDTDEFSAGAVLGMTRKETWLAGAHFGIVLYDIDIVYAERMDHLLKCIIERGGEFYFNDQCKPENWYPHRDNKVFSEYIVGRTFGAPMIENLKKTEGAIHIGV